MYYYIKINDIGVCFEGGFEESCWTDGLLAGARKDNGWQHIALCCVEVCLQARRLSTGMNLNIFLHNLLLLWHVVNAGKLRLGTGILVIKLR